MPPETDGLSIYASCGEFGVPARAWRLMLALAQHYGWQPQGTAPPDELAIDAGIWRGAPSDWDGRYFPAYGQNVTEADAAELAAALEQALPDIPDHDAVKDKADGTPIDWSWFYKVSAASVGYLAAFSGENKQTLRDFIAHCREKGGLWLY
jgi:hypothetical protein